MKKSPFAVLLLAGLAVKTELPYAGQVRVNFTLAVGQTSTTVDVVSTQGQLRLSF